MQAAQSVGHLAVDAHRVDEPRDADEAGVRRDEEDRRGEQADVELGRVLQRPEVDRLDDAEDRVAGVAALVLRAGRAASAYSPVVALNVTGSADSATAGSVK